MGDSYKEKEPGCHNPDGCSPPGYDGFYCHDDDFSLSPNNWAQDGGYLQNSIGATNPFLLSNPLHHSRHSHGDMNSGYPSVQQQHVHVPTFNVQALEAFDLSLLPYQAQHYSPVFDTKEPTIADDNESVVSASTDCDSHCDLADPCTDESCADKDACTDRTCPEKNCPDTDCPAKLTSEMADAAKVLTALPSYQQQSYDASQEPNENQDLCAGQNQNTFYNEASLMPLFDVMSHISVAHNDNAPSNCMRPCVIDNPQVFQHCPFPSSFDFSVDNYYGLGNPMSMNNFNIGGSFMPHPGRVPGFEECGAQIPNPEAFFEHVNTQHRPFVENIFAQVNPFAVATPPLQLARTESTSSSSNVLGPQLSSTSANTPLDTYPPTPLSLYQEGSKHPRSPGHSRSSTASLGSSGSEWEQRCLWCDPQTNEPCGMIFQTSDALFKHVNADHLQKLEKGPQGFLCNWDKCKRRGDGKEGFPQRSKIERHMHTHIGLKPFECGKCGKKFSAQQALQQHLLIHTDQKPLKCEWPGCGKTFRQQSALTMHRRIHTGDKPLKCPICGKAFSESSNLSKHKRIHEEKGRFTCQEPGCKRSFHRQDQLRRHMRLHPGGPDTKTANGEMEPGLDDATNTMATSDSAEDAQGLSEAVQPYQNKRSRR